MKHRIVCLLLALLTISPAVVSCGEAEKETALPESDVSPRTEASETTAENTIKDNLPELNFGDAVVSILHFGEESTISYDSSDWAEGKQGEIVSDAVVQRDMATEERLGVKLSYSTGSDVWGGYPLEVSKMIQAADCPYDLIFLETSQCFKLSLDGCFFNIADLPYVDLEQSWWYKNLMNNCSIQTSKRYSLIGAFSISTLECASCTVFNKKFFNSIYEDTNKLYDLVEEHKWTYDKFIEYCIGAYSDVNGNGEADDEDLFGLFNRGQQTVNYVSMSTGLDYTQRDESNYPVLDIFNEDSARWVEKLYRILNEDNISLTSTKLNGIEHFASGKALFFLGLLSEYTAPAVRSMNDPYGVLPMPVLDEGMEYKSAAGTVNGQSACIPVTSPTDRFDMYGAVLESLSIEAYRRVLPAWYEAALKSKFADTKRDADMIDIIYNTVDTSFIMVTDKLLSCGSFFWNMLGAGKKKPGDFASYYEKQSKSLLKKWDNMLAAFDALE